MATHTRIDEADLEAARAYGERKGGLPVTKVLHKAIREMLDREKPKNGRRKGK